jgi:hypothetical protein
LCCDELAALMVGQGRDDVASMTLDTDADLFDGDLDDAADRLDVASALLRTATGG